MLSTDYIVSYRGGLRVLVQSQGETVMRLDELFRVIPGSPAATVGRSPITRKVTRHLGSCKAYFTQHPEYLVDYDLLEVARAGQVIDRKSLSRR